MSETTKTSGEGPVSDEMLDAALSDVAGPSKEAPEVEAPEVEEPEVEEPVEGEEEKANANGTGEDVAEEPEDNRERSRLGRKVKELADSLGSTEARFEALMQKLEQITAKGDDDKAEPEFVDINDPEELRRVIREESARLAKEEDASRTKYENDYARAFLKHTGDGPESDEI